MNYLIEGIATHDVMMLWFRVLKLGLGKITSLLSSTFRPIFIAINWKNSGNSFVHYTFNGTLIKIMLLTLIGEWKQRS